MSNVGNYQVYKFDEHFEVWINGKRISSVDTIDEAYKEIDEEEKK